MCFHSSGRVPPNIDLLHRWSPSPIYTSRHSLKLYFPFCRGGAGQLVHAKVQIVLWGTKNGFRQHWKSKSQKPKAKSQSPDFSGLVTSKFLGVHFFCTKSRFFCTKSRNFCTKSKYFCTKSRFSVLLSYHFTVQICGSPNISVQSPNISVQSPNISVQSPNFLYKSRMGPNNLDFVQVQKMANSAVQIFLYKVQIFLYKVQIFLYKVQIFCTKSKYFCTKSRFLYLSYHLAVQICGSPDISVQKSKYFCTKSKYFCTKSRFSVQIQDGSK